MKRWNTLRIAAYAAGCGAAWIALTNAGQWGLSLDQVAASIGRICGGALGAAMLAAAVSGLRNLFVPER